MAANRLPMNLAKTDILWCPTSDQPSDSLLTLVGVTVLPSSEVRNLGAVFDSDLSLKAHVSQLTARCYSCLRRIKSCRRALTRTTAATVVNSLIVTRLDYCNGFLAGSTKQMLDKLQWVLNCSARVICGGNSSHHVTLLLRDYLHWLRARERISFKLCILVYKALHGLALFYLNEICTPVSTVPNLSALRSASRGDLLQLGNHAFGVAGPVAWNSLPLDIRSAPTLSTFKTCSRHIFSLIPTSLTNCFQSTRSELCTVPL